MNHQDKLKLLIPILDGALYPEDFNSIASHLKLEKWSPYVNTGKKKRSSSFATLLINTMIQFWNKNHVKGFPKAFLKLDKPILSRIVEKALKSEHGSPFLWILQHWSELLSCQTVLFGLDSFISGIKNVTKVTVDEWLLILHSIATGKSKTFQFFVAQLERNLAFSCEQKETKTVWNASARFLAPIMKSTLEDDFDKIVDYLDKSDVLKKADIQKSKKVKSKWLILLDLVGKSMNPKSIDTFLCAIEEQDYRVFAGTIRIYLDKNAPNLTWCVVNWEALIGPKHSYRVTHEACQLITTQASLSQCDAIPMLHILHRVAVDNHENMNKFMQAMQKLIPSFQIQLKSQPQNAAALSTESAKSQGQDTKSTSNGQQLFSNNKTTAKKQDSSTRESEQPSSSKQLVGKSGNSASYICIHVDDTTSKPEAVSKEKILVSTASDHHGASGSSLEAGLPSSQKRKEHQHEPAQEKKQGLSKTTESDRTLRSSTKSQTEKSSRKTEFSPQESTSHHLKPSTGNSSTSSNNQKLEVEFRMLVDKKCTIPDDCRLHIYLVESKNTIPLHQIDSSKRLYGTRQSFCRSQIPFEYKYFYLNADSKEIWETLPHGIWSNRNAEFDAGRLNDEHVIRFDVATFKYRYGYMPMGEIGSMYARNVMEHLPHASSIKFGEIQSDAISFATCLKQIEEWWKCALAPLIFYHERLSIRPSCNAELRNLIKKLSKYGNEKDYSERCRRVLMYLAVLVVMMKNEIKLEVVSEKEAMCAGLSVSNIECDNLKLLYDEINQDQNSLKEVLRALDALIPVITITIQSLWVVPLHYILSNNGSVTYVQETWNRTVLKYNFETISKQFDTKTVEDNIPIVLAMSKLFPQLMRLYQSAVPCSTILHLINTNHEAVQHLERPMFIIRLFTEINEENISRYIESKGMIQWIHAYLNELTESSPNSREDFKRLLGFHWKISLALLKPLKSLPFGDHNYDKMYQIVCVVVKVFSSWSKLIQFDPASRSEIQTAFTSIHQAVAKWIESDHDDAISHYFVQFWNFLLDVNVGDENLSHEWKERFNTTLQNVLLKKLDSDRFDSVLKTFMECLESKNPTEEVKFCFSEAIYQHIEQAEKKKVGFWNRVNLWKRTEFENLVPILERLFKDKWRCFSPQNESGVLQFVLSWPFAAKFFKLFDEPQNKRSLSHDTGAAMDFIRKRMQAIIHDLETGDVNFRDVNLISQAKKTFKEILDILADSSGTSVDGWGALIDKRTAEVEAFKEIESACQYLIDLNNSKDLHCFDLLNLQSAMERNKNEIRWRDIVDVTFFELSDDVKSALKEIKQHRIKDADLILTMWLNEVEYCIKGKLENDDDDGSDDEERTKNNLLDVDDISIVWKRLKLRVASLKKQINSGCLTLLQVDEIFHKYDGANLRDNISRLVDVMYGYPDDEVACDDLSLDTVSVADSESYATADDDETSHVGANDEETIVELDLEDQLLEDGRNEGDEPLFTEQASPSFKRNLMDDGNQRVGEEQSVSQEDVSIAFDGLPAVDESDKDSNVDAQLDSKPKDCSNLEVVPQLQGEEPLDEHDSANESELVEEAEFLKTDEDRKTFRVGQICNYFTLKHQQETARVFDNLRKCLKLTGDFTYLDIVQQSKAFSKERPLKCITKGIMEASKTIMDIDKKTIPLIGEFMKHQELIDWLRENMKDRGEVKVMSDLAMISAGETTLEVDRVSCFLSAVMGFAPFIFDIPKDGDLQYTLQAFKSLSSINDPNLAKKWHATAKHLEWLKGIKDFHGSVEKSSLSRAQDINAKGIYTIGGERDKIPSVENALKLEIREKDKDSVQMNMAELRNLQSRLMLIAGEADKGLDDVKRFIEVLSHVENLTKAYVKLKLAGCLLFNNWIATISCASQTESPTVNEGYLLLMFDEKCQPVLCNENVVEEIMRLTAVMENIHSRWRENLSEKRRDYYHLNHFNIQQMTYLCKELAKVSDEKTIPDQVYTLLAFVKPDVTGSEIVEILREAMRVKSDVQPEGGEDFDEDLPEISLIEKKRQLVRRLVEEEISERIAKAVVQKSELDYEECCVKALEFEFEDDDLINDLVKEFDKESGFDANTSEVNVIRSVVNDQSHLTLQAVIEKILSAHDDRSNVASVTVKTICERYVDETAVTSLSDCISTEHLGHFLTSLGAKKDNAKNSLRVFPETLEEGKPNLIICPEHDMFSTLLSLYMRSPEQSLPTLSEVLLCNESTSKEEVELLLRRAIGQPPNSESSIYCLAFAEKLSFEVANATENMMKQLEKDPGINKTYRFVVLCATSQHYMASLLYEKRVDYSHHHSIEQIQQYLSDHLRLDNSELAASSLQGKQSIRTSVLVVSSDRAGLGKSLFISRCRDRLRGNQCRKLVVRLLDKQLNEDDVMDRLFYSNKQAKNRAPHFIHFDLTPSVQEGVGTFLFNFFVLGGFANSVGTLWRRQPSHVYAIEYTNSVSNKDATVAMTPEQRLLSLLPAVTCVTPKKVLEYYKSSTPDDVLLMDEQEFRSESFQRSYQYLSRYGRNENLDRFSYQQPEGSPPDCIESLLRYCSISDPTWSELRHFASFLSNQLSDCEESSFCNEALVGADSGLSGFKKFVVRFMIRMSQDFATPSLDVHYDPNSDGTVLEHHQLRRRWEEAVHPYLFFNEDGMSMTFINFRIDNSGNLLNPKNTSTILEKGIMAQQLASGLKMQRVNLNEDFDKLERREKLLRLRRVMGLKEYELDMTDPDRSKQVELVDPDPTYELTTDNVLKMLAIHMRFRCGIPVVVMGETGCGKTRMVEFMSKLKCGNKLNETDSKSGENQNANSEVVASTSNPEKTVRNEIDNMFVVKVHGGVTVPIIQDSFRKATELARLNKEKHEVDTMLFLDEANTTEAIYAIKEFVCDRTVNGETLKDIGLHIVCACNPYRKHGPEAIKSMAEAGLGFRVKTEDTTDKLGNVPMRCLVYRVIALPPSMKPLVWDFGQLTNEAEKVYIEQMVHKMKERHLKTDFQISPHELQLIVSVLCKSQRHMRDQRQQCLFVSLRDVERCLQSFTWFFENRKWLYPEIDEQRRSIGRKPFSENQMYSTVIIRTLMQAIGMCYHVTLENRGPYHEVVCDCFHTAGYQLTSEDLLVELNACQSVFINSIDVEENIARNEALRENVFMIVMCTEMRIPLFLIGKPGSSKSLAKTIVTDAMQGPSSVSPIFRRLKQIHILSFQCSAVSDAVGIEAVFTQCAQVQRNQDPEKFVSVVVLDEVGLAEDSPKMPLKVLHPLLEGSSIQQHQRLLKTDKQSEDNQDKNVTERKVGFVGISNWALDPAKMNRGIFVHRGDPSEHDLKLTAKGIFSDSKQFKEVDEIVDVLTASYLEIRETQTQEFFGLRDYYGLLKMIFSVVNNSDAVLNYFHVADAIKRNFSGGKIDCFDIFIENVKSLWSDACPPTTSIEKMIKDNLSSVNEGETESRFLLLLTNRFAAVNLLNKVVDCSKFQVIFGSSFPQDNDYTELCKNINKIKICMESGCTVVLLNLRDLYESLYDALNQHYVTFAEHRYVDLGLGGHRVKCRVAQNFRLIVIEDRNVVYDEFPIPLINRLEKYIFTTESILDGDLKQVAGHLKSWVSNFSTIDIPLHKQRTMKQFSSQDCFVGFVDDSSASALLAVGRTKDPLQKGKYILLNTATVDSVFRLPKSSLKKEAGKLQEKYFSEQNHDNLISFFKDILSQSENDSSFASPAVFEITSFSQILSEQDRKLVEAALEMPKNSVMLLTLQQFQTQDEYNKKVESFFLSSLTESVNHSDQKSHPTILLIQCPNADRHGNLIACARFSVKNAIQKQEFNRHVIIAFLYTIERQCGTQSANSLFSYHGSDCVSVHIDELRPSVDYMGPPSNIYNQSVSDLFEQSVQNWTRHIEPAFCNFVEPSFLLDPFILVKNCIPNAMVKLINSYETGEENQRNRMKILHDLCCCDKPVSNPFKQILVTRIAGLLKDRDRFVDPTSWSVDEACSQEALHEGGTFSKTLWLGLRKVVTVILAKIVSVIDEDNNLDIICAERLDNALADLWLRMFDDAESCKISCRDVLRSSSQFTVKRLQNFECEFPFSRNITECFNRIWEFLPNDDVTKIDIFFRKIQNMKLHDILTDSFSNKQLPLSLYIHDLVHLQYRPSTQNSLELNLIQDALQAMFECKVKDNTIKHEGNLVAAFYGLFMTNRSRLVQLSDILEVLPESLTEQNVQSWMQHQRTNGEFVLHILAYQSVLQHVEKQLDNISDPERYRQWRNRTTKILNAKLDHSKVCGDMHEPFSDVYTMRNCLAFAELFLNMLIPEGLCPELFGKYLEILASYSKRLCKAGKTTGLSNHRFLTIVIKILRGCSKDVFLKHLLEWQDPKCKQCQKPRVVKPVILPCGHYFCEGCIQITTASNVRKCPTCRADYPFDFPLNPAKLSPEQAKEYDGFKTNCTSFFLQYLSTLCFPAPDAVTSEMAISTDISEILQNLVMTKKATRELTPVDMETFDQTPTVRSFILQLLLRFNPKNTRDILEQYFKKMNEVFSDKQELMLIYIRCVEDSLRNKALVNQNRIPITEFLEPLVEEVEECFALFEDPTQVVILDIVARVRFCMKETTKLIYNLHSANRLEEDIDTISSLLELLSSLIKRHDLHLAQQYFVKLLCRRYGLGIFYQLVQRKEFCDLIPQELNQDELTTETTVRSALFVLGEEYVTTQKMLFNVASDDDVDEVVTALLEKASKSGDATVQVLHATHEWCRNGQSEEVQERKENLWRDLLQRCSTFTHFGRDVENYFNNLANKGEFFKPTQTIPPDLFHILHEFVLVAGSTICCGNDTVLRDLQELIENPGLMQTWFLPTMPESGYFKIKDIVSTWRDERHGKPPKAYKCPSGHVYFIKDCTAPNESGICPDCRKKIGGYSYGKLQPGNVAGELSESSQAGYLLGMPGARSSSVTPERKLERLPVCVVRLFLHATLLHASIKDSHILRNLLPLEDGLSVPEFLLLHMQVDFTQFLNCLGKSVDDAALLLHQIMKGMRTQENFTTFGQATLTSMSGREVWEDSFNRNFLATIFSQADEKIDEARKICSSCQRQDDLEKLVYEIPEEDENLLSEDNQEEIVPWSSPLLWKYQIHVTAAHLRQKLEGFVGQDNREGEILKLILNQTDLSVIQNLPKLLALQTTLIQRFQRKVDISDVDNMTIERYMEEDEGLEAKENFQLYVAMWNSIKENLSRVSFDGTPMEGAGEDMTLKSPISMCLPSKAGFGRCALAMMEHIVLKQNDFLLKCKEIIRPTPSFDEISLEQLSINDLVCIDNDQNLMPLILANSQYEVSTGEAGTKHNITYRIPALEKQVTEKFILNKKLLNKQTLPFMEFLQDVGIGKICEDMKQNVEQESLPPKITQKLDEIMGKSRLPDICEGVRTLTLVISNLAKMESDPDVNLIKYITEDLMVPPNEAAMIPKASLLRHTMALYERLSWQRSVRFLASGQDPFANISGHDNYEGIENVDEVKTILEQIKLPQLQLELNSLILMKQDLNPHLSLKESLHAYLEEKYSEEDGFENYVEWCMKLPANLKIKHAPHLFRISLRIKSHIKI